MTEMMKAAVLVGPEKIETKLEPVPEMKAGDIRIRVSATGVCGSDIHMWKTGKGWNPNHKGDFWMGHEFCGVVEDPGTSDFEVGDRVVFWANLYCGECDMCRAGQEHLCREVNGTNYPRFFIPWLQQGGAEPTWAARITSSGLFFTGLKIF